MNNINTELADAAEAGLLELRTGLERDHATVLTDCERAEAWLARHFLGDGAQPADPVRIKALATLALSAFAQLREGIAMEAGLLKQVLELGQITKTFDANLAHIAQTQEEINATLRTTQEKLAEVESQRPDRGPLQ